MPDVASVNSEPVAALVVAAGSGVRLGGGGPKALRELGGRPLVSWSIDAMAAGGAAAVVLVVAAGTEAGYADVVEQSPIPVRLVPGGSSRQESVANGLAALPEDAEVVLIHDAARPLVPVEVVTAVVAAVRSGARAVVPVVPLADTIRRLDRTGSQVLDRSLLRAVQTPQGFRRSVVVAAHEAGAGATYTDDAAVCEAFGVSVTLVAGSVESLKVTTAVDLALVATILAGRT